MRSCHKVETQKRTSNFTGFDKICQFLGKKEAAFAALYAKPAKTGFC
jgi:hypothetical protein